MSSHTHTSSTAKLPRQVRWGMACFVLITGITGYLLVGTPSGWQVAPRAEISTAHAPSTTTSITTDDARIKGLVEQLAEQLKIEPVNPDGWTMLARSYATLRRVDESLPAYRKAIEQRPDNAQLYAEYADVLAQSQGRLVDGEPARLLEKALRLDKTNVKALMLSGSAAYDRQDYKTAASRWAQAMQHTPHDNPSQKRQIQQALDDARQRAKLIDLQQGKTSPPRPSR